MWFPDDPAAQMPWQPCAQELLDAARRDGRPAMIYFPASWSAPCRMMERKVFSRVEIVDAARRFVVLKADTSDTQSEPMRALREKYAVARYPTVVFLRPDGMEERSLRLVGCGGPKAFLKRLAAMESRKRRSNE